MDSPDPMIGIKARRILPIRQTIRTASVGTQLENVAYVGGKPHLVLEEDFHRPPEPTMRRLCLEAALVELSPEVFSARCLARVQEYGAAGSCLVDMKGIRNLIFAKALPFSDEVVRSLLLRRDFMSPNATYLYFGLGGAAPQGSNGAGEYIQFSVLDGRSGGGVGWGLKGHLSGGSVYGATSVLGEGTSILPDHRFAYSQMALLRRRVGREEVSLGVRIESRKMAASFLDALAGTIDQLSIRACALTILVSGRQREPITILGRVTKGRPARPWHKIQDAADSAVEQTFLLGPEQVLVGFGNRRYRQEPDWHRLTRGREYQARGHIHATVLGSQPGWSQHTTFHLKDIFLPSGAVALAAITPVERTVRIFPLSTENGDLVCEATGRSVPQL